MSDRDSGAAVRSRLEDRLRRLRRRRLWLDAGAAAATGLAWLAGLGALLVLLEALLYLPPAWRAALGAAVLVAVLGVPGRWLWRRWRAGLPLRRIALDVEARAPELAQRLITALELAATDDQRTSVDLLAAAAAEADGILAGLEPARVVPAGDLRRRLRLAAAAAGLAAVTGLLLAGASVDALHRLLHPGTAFARPQRTYLRVTPAQQQVVRGDDAVVTVHLRGERPATVRVERLDEGASQAIVDEVLVEPGASDTLVYRFPEVRRPFTFQVAAGDGRSGPHTVDVIDPPAVSRLALAYEYPAYTGLPARLEEDGGDIRALAGTRVEFRLTASKPLAAATLVVDDSLRWPATVVDDRARVTWTLPAPADSGAGRHEYVVRLRDRAGVANRDPIRYAIQILRDGAPTVSIPVPGRDGDLPESQQMALEVEAADDYGIDRLELVFRVNDGPAERLRLAADGGRQLRVRRAWDLSGRDLLPEDRVRYHAEVWDNDAVAGPKKAVSQEFELRFPSLYELFEEASTQQQERLDDLETVADESAAAREHVEQLQREVLRTEKLTWEQRQELESTLAAEQERANKVSEAAQEISQTLDQLEEGGLDSEELLDKLGEIRELMAAVTTPEMLEALQELQQAMDNPDPDQLADALRRFAEDQEAFQERLDRTLELLRQVHAEQRLLAAVTQAQDLEARQAQIDADLDAGEPRQRLREQEASLARDTDRLQDELDSLGDEFEPLDANTAQALAQQAQQMAQQQLSGRMRQMQQTLTSSPTDARRQGAGLEEDLGRLSQALKGLQESFAGQQRNELSRQLRDAMAALVELSAQQEALAGEIGQHRGLDVADLALRQETLARGVELVVEQIGQVSRRTMAVESGLAATVGYALKGMADAAEHLSQQEGGRASQRGAAAMGYLNEAVLQLRQSLDNLSQARTPSAFGEAMEKMMGLSQQQAALNEATQQALQQGSQPGQQGQRGRDALPRLAAEQRRIFRALGEVEKSLRGQRSMEGRVERIRQEMEGVMAQMERRQADPSLRRGQQRILQRMLDASRSIHERGFDKRRRSESAEQRLYTGPAWLPADLGQHPDAIGDAMRRALAGNYPEEYKQLIRSYYESLYRDLQAPAAGAREESTE